MLQELNRQSYDTLKELLALDFEAGGLFFTKASCGIIKRRQESAMFCRPNSVK
jgi:hypothetical protein